MTIIQIKLRFRKSPPYREIIVILIAYAQITFGARWKYERKMNGDFVEEWRKLWKTQEKDSKNSLSGRLMSRSGCCCGWQRGSFDKEITGSGHALPVIFFAYS